LGLDHVDVFYSHRFDPDTPLEETMAALDTAIRSGKARYAGISSYPPEATVEAARILRNHGTPLLVHQPSYSMFARGIEKGLLDVLENTGVGCIAFSPLSQGLLTDRYLNGIPPDSRAATSRFLQRDAITDEKLARLRALREIAARRGRTLAQLALAWALRDNRMTSVIVGASSVGQLEENVRAVDDLFLDTKDLAEIDRHAAEV
jgi:L-glyceraldehyde 3-phosphate reductase